MLSGQAGCRCRKPAGSHQSPLGQPENEAGCKATNAVTNAAAEVDGGRVGRIARRTRHFSDRTSQPHSLSKNFVIEYEVVGVGVEWQSFEQLTREGSIPRVKLGHL